MNWRERFFGPRPKVTDAITDEGMRDRIVALVRRDYGHMPLVGEVLPTVPHKSPSGTCTGSYAVTSVDWTVNNAGAPDISAWGYCAITSVCNTCEHTRINEYGSS